MKIRPLHDRIVVRRTEEEQKQLAVFYYQVRLPKNRNKAR